MRRVVEAVTSRLYRSNWAALLWFPIRIWLGYQWLEAASHKLGNEAWGIGGGALTGFWTNAIAIPAEGRPAIAFDWYRSFLTTLLENGVAEWAGPIIVGGELLVGAGLMVGAFVGVTAFFGALMNMNFLLAGSASVNPVFLVISIFLIMSRRVSGLIGFDGIVHAWKVGKLKESVRYWRIK